MLREYLISNGYEFEDEAVTIDDGKYYFGWRIRFGACSDSSSATYEKVCESRWGMSDKKDIYSVGFCYSSILLNKSDMVYRDYLLGCKSNLAVAIGNIQSHSPNNPRLDDLTYELSLIDNILESYYNHNKHRED